MAMLMINGWAAPAPSMLQLTLADVQTGVSRSASGRAVMDRSVQKRRLEIRWAHMTRENLARLLQETTGFFDADYPDPLTGTTRTMQCCCGEKTAGILRMQDGQPVWTDIKMTWTER